MRRNEMEVALLAVMAASSTGTAIGLIPLPGSLEDGPSVFGQTAAVTLWAGCLIGLLGIAWRDRLDGLVIEQLGMVGVTVGGILYAVALITAAGPWTNAILAIGMSLGVAVAAGVRYWGIYRYLRTLRQVHEGRDNGER